VIVELILEKVKIILKDYLNV